MKKVICIAWESHQRTKSLTSAMDIPLYEIVFSARGIKRYAKSTFKTFKIIITERPRTLIVQNPSIILTTFCLILKPLFRYRLIVDAHNEAIHPFIHTQPVIMWLSKLLIRHSDHTIVTNDALANVVRGKGGNPLVLPDLLPKVQPVPFLNPPSVHEPWKVTLISTYAPDEPYEAVFQALSLLGKKFSLSVTGRVPASLTKQPLPGNVKLTGYLTHSEYWDLLAKSHFLIDLTTMDDCLVCGAYEGLALEKPIVLSHNEASVSLFGGYAIHVSNNAGAIAKGISVLAEEYDDLPKKIGLAKNSFIDQEALRITQLKCILASID